MDEVQRRMTRFRVPGGAPDSGKRDEPDEPDEPGYSDRAMPLAVSILWTPLSGSAQDLPTIPIFVTQRVLAAVLDHGAATSGACFGLLTGDLFRAPDRGAPFVVVQSTIRLPGPSGDDAKAALLQGWVVAQDAVRKTGDQLVGWYRVGDSAALALAGAQVEAHAALFPQPWQLVVSVSSGAASTGGVFRPLAGDSSRLEPLSFYEVCDHLAMGSDGTKHTLLQWTNYRSADPTLVPAAAPVPAPAGDLSSPEPTALAPRAPLFFLPDELGGGKVAQPTSRAVLRRLWQRPEVRFTTYGAVGLAALVGSIALFRPSPRAPEPFAGAPALVASPLVRLDRAADTLALALAAFDLRVRLFSSRQMQCAELARGLVLVEERWTAYNAARKEGGFALDSARTARDRTLYADADAVERRFERSLCPRP